MSPQAQGHLAMLSFSALVAGSFSLGALVANDLPPAALNAVRFAIAMVVVGAVVLATQRGGIPRAALRAPWRYMVLGGLYAVYFVLMFEGLKTAPPVSAAAVFTLVPLMSAVFAIPMLAQRLTPRMTLALGIGAVGALWVIFRGQLSAFLGFDVGRGEAIYFVGCISHALYTPMVRKLNRGENVLVFTFGTIIAGTIVLTIWGWNDIRATDWTALRPLVWITIAYIAVFASATTILLVQFATLRLPSAKVMAYTYLVPTWVIVWEIALGGRVPGAIVLVGIALTAVALLLLLRDDSRTVR